MASEPKNFILGASPGIKRDGSVLEGVYYTDGKWCRFYRNKPRKIGGYRSMTNDYSGVSRGLFGNTNTGYVSIFSGTSDVLEVANFTMNGYGAAPTDRTPAAFVTNANNIWQFAQITEGASDDSMLVAHAGQNLTDIDSQVQTEIYYGNVLGSAALTGTGQSVSGGVVAIGPYLAGLDNNGLFWWTQPNAFAFDPARVARPTGKKLVCGREIRGGAQAPSALLWSLDTVLRVGFVGSTAVWQFDTVAVNSSIMSSSCPVEADGIIYWITTDRFMTYNGVARELKNELSGQDFFDNVNLSQRQKIYGFRVPRFGEIWWCYPRGTATECNWALIYNIKYDTWYDTPLPHGGRSAAISPNIFPYPVMATADPLPYAGYPMWMHEFEFNEIFDSRINAIESYFTTPEVSLVAGLGQGVEGNFAPGSDNNLQLIRIDPDFQVTGPLDITLLGRPYPMAPDHDETVALLLTGDQPFNTFTWQERYNRFKFTSNAQNGFYELGQTVIQTQEGDPRP